MKRKRGTKLVTDDITLLCSSSATSYTYGTKCTERTPYASCWYPQLQLKTLSASVTNRRRTSWITTQMCFPQRQFWTETGMFRRVFVNRTISDVPAMLSVFVELLTRRQVSLKEPFRCQCAENMYNKAHSGRKASRDDTSNGKNTFYLILWI
jgi:hypothetical protein